MAHTKTPLHAYELEGKRWVDAARYPFPEATPTTMYLGAGRTLGDRHGFTFASPPAVSVPVCWSK